MSLDTPNRVLAVEDGTLGHYTILDDDTRVYEGLLDYSHGYDTDEPGKDITVEYRVFHDGIATIERIKGKAAPPAPHNYQYTFIGR